MGGFGFYFLLRGYNLCSLCDVWLLLLFFDI